MPVNDQRIFKSGEHWWVAIVNSAHGMGSSNGLRRMNRDEVTFTCLTDHSAVSKKAEIQSGELNSLKHSAIIEMLRSASVLDSRTEIRPINLPHDPTDSEAVFIDETGLRWILKSIRLPNFGNSGKLHYGVEVICLDDSAIRKTIGMSTEFTLIDFIQTWGLEAKKELIGIVDQEYKNLNEVLRRRKPSSMSNNPLDVIANEADAIFGNKKLQISMPVFFAASSIPYKKEEYSVSAGIMHGRVFARTKPRNRTIEIAIIEAIENHPENAYVSDEIIAILNRNEN